MVIGCAAATLVGAGAPDKMKDREQASQVYLPNSGVRGIQTLKVGDDALVVPLVWARAAKLGRTIEIVAGDHKRTIDVGTILPAEYLAAGEGLADGYVAFCTPREAKERGLDRSRFGGMFSGSLWRGLVRSLTDAQYCLVDRDHDGQADASIMVGEGWGPERSLRPIDPVPLTVADDVSISPTADKFRITFTNAGSRGPTFTFAIVQQFNERAFTTFGGQTAKQSFRSEDGGWPRKAEIAGALFVIKSYDPVAKTVTIEWPEDVERTKRIAVADGVKYEFRYY